MEKTFSDAFNEHLTSSGEKVTVIAEKTGITKDALYALKRGTTRNMNVSDAILLARHFGETVEEFMGLTPAKLRGGLVERFAKLSPREQAILEASITAILEAQDTATSEPPSDK